MGVKIKELRLAGEVDVEGMTIKVDSLDFTDDGAALSFSIDEPLPGERPAP